MHCLKYGIYSSQDFDLIHRSLSALPLGFLPLGADGCGLQDLGIAPYTVCLPFLIFFGLVSHGCYLNIYSPIHSARTAWYTRG